MMEASAASGKDIILPMITEKLIAQLKNGITKVGISITLDGESYDVTQLQNVKLILPAILLQKAKEFGIDLQISIKDKEGKERYTWYISATDLKIIQGEMTDINLLLTVWRLVDHTIWSDPVNNTKDTENGLVVQFLQEGRLPVPCRVKIYVGDLVKLRDHRIYFYYYNQATGKLNTLPYSSGYQVDGEGFIMADILRGSEYMMMTKAADTNIVASLLDQIEVAVNKTTIYLDAEDPAMRVRITALVTLEQVSETKKKTGGSTVGVYEITYKSLNERIATVDRDGVITATGKGKTTIYVIITLYSGKTSVRKLTVKVK